MRLKPVCVAGDSLNFQAQIFAIRAPLLFNNPQVPAPASQKWERRGNGDAEVVGNRYRDDIRSHSQLYGDSGVLVSERFLNLDILSNSGVQACCRGKDERTDSICLWIRGGLVRV